MQPERPPLLISSPSLNAYVQPRMSSGDDEEDDENSSVGGFEFSFDCCAESPIPADLIFHNGRIKPIIIFDDHQQAASAEEKEDRGITKTTSKRKALRRLFTEERPEQSLSVLPTESSGPALPPADSDSYCVWEPPPKSTANREIGNSSSSKRWKLRDLLTRNASSGAKDSARSRSGNSNIKISPSKNDHDDDDDDKVVEATPQRQPQLVRKTAMKEGGGGRRSSYLPYRQELVGIFGRNLHRAQ